MQAGRQGDGLWISRCLILDWTQEGFFRLWGQVLMRTRHDPGPGVPLNREPEQEQKKRNQGRNAAVKN